MMTSNKSRIIFLVVVVLLIANTILTSIMWLKMNRNLHGHQRFSPPPERGAFIIDELGFDSMQTLQFRKISDEHFKKLDELKEKEHQLKDKFFSLFKSDTASKEIVLYYASQSANIQMSIDTLNYTNFQRIRAICNEEQKLKFFEIIQRIFMSPPPENQGLRPMPIDEKSSGKKDSFSNERTPRLLQNDRPGNRNNNESFVPPHRPEGAPDGPPPGFREGHRPPPPPRHGERPDFNRGDFHEDGPPPRPDDNP